MYSFHIFNFSNSLHESFSTYASHVLMYHKMIFIIKVCDPALCGSTNFMITCGTKPVFFTSPRSCKFDLYHVAFSLKNRVI